MSVVSNPVQAEPSHPYAGLRPFRAEEAEIFFGREEHVDQLLAKLETTHFLAIVGVSGCGKSSLLRAGLIPALRTGFMGSAGGRWRVAEFRPGDRPRARLAAAIAHEAILGGEQYRDPASLALVEATLRKGPLGLIELLRESPPPPHTNILVFVDQFEEIFRYRATASAEEAEAFIALLLATAASREFPVYVAVAMRSDFIGECAVFAGLPEAINESQYLTPRLTREQIHEAIVRPARLFGGDIEPEIVNRLLNEIGPESDQLPVLQHALMRMWESARQRSQATAAPTVIGAADYDGVGSLSRALNDHAEQIFRSLGTAVEPEAVPDASVYRTARVLFQQLTQGGEGRRDIRRPARLSEVTAVAGVADAEMAAVVRRFRGADNCFLAPASQSVPGEDDTDEVIDIGHESLIRKWERLSKWVALEFDSAAVYRRLFDTARRWERGQAAPLTNPDLSNALEWRREQRPTEAWARRYGQDDPAREFALVMRLLDESAAIDTRSRELAEAQDRERREHEARERELVRTTRTAATLRRLAAGLILAVGVALALAYWAWIQRSAADSERQIARARELAAIGAGRLDVEPNLAAAFALRSLETPTIEGEVLLRQSLFRLADKVIRTAPGMSAIAYSPDGRSVAIGYGDGALEIRSRETGAATTVIAATPKDGSAHVDAVVFVDGGRRLAALLGSRPADRRIVLVDAVEGATPVAMPSPPDRRKTCGGQAYPDKLAFALRRTLLASSWSDGRVIAWDLSSGVHALALDFRREPCEPVSDLQFTGNGDQLFVAYADLGLLSWRTAFLGKPPVKIALRPGSEERDRLDAISIDAQGERALTVMTGVSQGTHLSEVRLVSLENGATIRTLVQDAREVVRPFFSPNNDLVVAARPDGNLDIWDAVRGQPQRTLRGHAGDVVALAVRSPVDGPAHQSDLASAGADGTVRLWSFSALPSQTLRGHRGLSSTAAFSPDGTWLVSGGSDGTVRVWDVRTGRELRQLGKHRNDVYAVAVSPDGKLVASAGGTAISSGGGDGDRTIRLWDPATGGTPVRTIEPPADVIAMAFSPDGSLLATGGAEAGIRLWEPASGRAAGEVGMEGGRGLYALAFSRDGKLIAEAGQVARIFDRVTRTQLAETQKSPGTGMSLSAAVFGDDDRVLLTTSFGDSFITLWDARNGKLVRQFKGYGPANSADISRDGTLAVTGDLKGVSRVWDVRTGAFLAGLIGTESAWSVVFSANGKRIATTSGNGPIFLWDCEPCGSLPDLRRIARERLKDTLTDEQVRTVAAQ